MSNKQYNKQAKKSRYQMGAIGRSVAAVYGKTCPYQSTTEAAKDIGVSLRTARYMLADPDRVHGAVVISGAWLWPSIIVSTVHDGRREAAGPYVPMVGTTEIAHQLGVTRRQAQRLCKSGAIKAYKVAGVWITY